MSGPAVAAHPSDAELVAQIMAGESAAFDALVRRHYSATFAVALAVTGDRADAEDACHDGFVDALARIESCRTPARVAQWIAAIVRNRACDLLTAPARRRATTLDDSTPARDKSPAQTVALDELRTLLESALAKLPPIQREVVLLHDLHDWSHDDIAELLRTSAGMSRQHLFKARRRLRELLDPTLLKELSND